MICIIDYAAGNLTSVKRALDFLGIPAVITSDCANIRSASRIIFPGVGHAASAMRVMREKCLDIALLDAFKAGTPILGICLGTQIVLSHSDEGDTRCVGLIEGNCPRFQFRDPSLKIPHMGWNSIKVVRTHPLLRGVSEGDEFYFVHSFYPQPSDPAFISATCNYDIDFPAAIGHKNLFATQFHPEKSGRMGLAILKNFATWDGAPC
jgi:glutamine amidotransferase